MVEGGSLNFKSAALNVDKETVEQTRLSSGISKPHPHDVLAGRGASINQHPGNQYFRSLVKHLKNEYVVTPKSEKPQFAKLVVKHIRALKPPGRFLRQAKGSKEWTAMDDKGALDKTRQALREDAAKFKSEIDAGLRTVDTNVRTSITKQINDRAPTTLLSERAHHASLNASLTASINASMSNSINGNMTTSILENELRNQSFISAASMPNNGQSLTNSHTSSNTHSSSSMNRQSFGHPMNPPFHGSSRNSSMTNSSLNHSMPPLQMQQVSHAHTQPMPNMSNFVSVNSSTPLQYSINSQLSQPASLMGNAIANRQSLVTVKEVNSLRSLDASSDNMGMGTAAFPNPAKRSITNHNTSHTYSIPNSTLDMNMHSIDFDDGKEDFPCATVAPASQPSNRYGSVTMTNSDDDGKEEFLLDNSNNYHNRDQTQSMVDNDDDKEEFLGGCGEVKLPLDDGEDEYDYKEEFPGDNRNGLNRSLLYDGKEDFPDGNDCAFPAVFYDLDDNTQIKMRSSFVGGKSKRRPPVSRDRHSLYLPDMDKNLYSSRRRSSAMNATKLLEQLQKFDAEASEDDESDIEEDHRAKRKFPDANEAVSHLRNSLRASLKIDDIFKPDSKRADRRRSKRVSLLLRQSLISSWANINDCPDVSKNSVSLPDLFDTKHDRRRSTITESSQDLLKKVFGNQRDCIPTGSEQEILREILDPLSSDVLMASLLSVGSLDDTIGSDIVSNNGGDNSNRSSINRLSINRSSVNGATANSTIAPAMSTGMMNLNMGHA
jgi:hypothetical protein